MYFILGGASLKSELQAITPTEKILQDKKNSQGDNSTAI